MVRKFEGVFPCDLCKETRDGTLECADCALYGDNVSGNFCANKQCILNADIAGFHRCEIWLDETCKASTAYRGLYEG